MNNRQSRRLVIGFVLALVGFCVFFTFGLSPYLMQAAQRSDAFHLLGKCLEIASGDTLLIDQRGEERWIRLIGIEAPAFEESARLQAQVERLGRDPDWIQQQARVSRNTLAAWVYRRGLHITYPWGEDALDEDGRHWAYAEVAGINLAYKLLQGGQVLAVDVDHPERGLFAEMEAQARDQGRGLWRAGGANPIQITR